MANTYSPDSLGIKAPSGGFQQGGWYNGRQYWNGTLSDAGVIHPESNQQGAGQAVSAETNAQSAAAQGVTTKQFNDYLAKQNAMNPKAPIGNSGFTSQSGTVDNFGGSISGAGGSGGIGGVTNTPTLDLAGLYKNLSQTAGITDIETKLSDAQKSFNDAQSKINDNPYLSEADRVGRVQKLQTDFNNNTAELRNELATKKADIETQVQIATKQFDINSQAAQQAMQQFNQLLSMGALDNASGEDIANITRATGLSSTMIQNAISKRTEGNVKPQVIQSTDDNGNVTVSIIDVNTGKLISQQSLGDISTTKKSAGGGGSTRETTADVKASIGSSYSDYINNKVATINGRTGHLQTILSPEDFYLLMTEQFPGYIDQIPKAKDIRKVTGQ